MKVYYYLLVLFTLHSCQSDKKSKNDIIIFTEDFSIKHPDWKIIDDTTKIDTVFRFEKFEVPVQYSWAMAKDKEDCLHIRYFEFSGKDNNTSKVISEVRASQIQCAMKFESDDTLRFETLLVQGKFEDRKGIKTYTYTGPFITIRGNGQYTIKNDSFKD